MAKSKRKRKRSQAASQEAPAAAPTPASTAFTLPPKVIAIVCLVWIVICPFYSVFQGIDLTDMGYAASLYQQVFRNPDSVHVTLLIWLSNIIGGIWLLLTDWMGYVSLKVGHAVVTWLSVWAAYWLLKRYFNRERLLIALAVATWFISGRSLSQWIGYDDLTALFYTIGAAALGLGIKRRSKFLIGLAGFVLAINTHVRLPNVLGVGFVILIPFYAWLRAKPLKGCLRDIGCFAAGAGISVAVAALLFVVTRQRLVDMDLLQLVLQGEGHTPLKQLERQGKAYGTGLYRALVGFVVIGAASIGVAKAKVRELGIILAIVCGLVMWQSVFFVRYSGTYYVSSALVIILVGQIIVLKRRCPTLSLFSGLALLQLLCMPLGSNTGLIKSCHGMWLAIPIALLSIQQWRSLPFDKARICTPDSFRNFAWCLSGILFLVGTGLAWQNTYRDAGQLVVVPIGDGKKAIIEKKNRKRMNTKVSGPKVKMLWTTPERAEVMQEFLDNFQEHIKPGEYAYMATSIPGLHYITETKPFLYMPWQELLRKGHGDALKMARDEIGSPDVVIFTRERAYGARNALWPFQPNTTDAVVLRRFPALAKKANYIPNAKHIPFHDLGAVYELKWAGKLFMIYRINRDIPLPPKPAPKPTPPK